MANIKRSSWKDGAQRNVPRDPLPWFKPSSGNGLKDIRITQPMNHMNQLLTHGMQETLKGTMIGAHIEGLELSMGSSTPTWDFDIEHWDKLMTKSWIKHTWKETQDFGIDMEDSVPKLPEPVEGDIDLD